MSDYKQYLEDQLALSKRRDQLLEQMENTLQQMKALAVQRANTLSLSDADVQDLNKTFGRLKSEVSGLKRQLEALDQPSADFRH